MLSLNGWIFPTDASINFAIAQSSVYEVVQPHLQVPARGVTSEAFRRQIFDLP